MVSFKPSRLSGWQLVQKKISVKKFCGDFFCCGENISEKKFFGMEEKFL